MEFLVIVLGILLAFCNCNSFIQIYVRNEANFESDFYIFQRPAIYTGRAKVYINSLGMETLTSKEEQIQWSFAMQHRIAVQRKSCKPQIGGTVVSHQITELCTEQKCENDAVRFKIDDLGDPHLYDLHTDPNVQKGAMRVVTPIYPPGKGVFNVGLGTVSNGVLLLSNFIVARPNNNIDIQPINQFFVATGSYKTGHVVNFTESSVQSALCDATNGQTVFYVSLKSDGTWTVGSTGFI